MQKNKKLIMVILIALAVVSLALGAVGYLESKKENKEPKVIIYDVLYRYYLNDVEVEQMPTNPTLVSSSTEVSSLVDAEKLYAFNTASCTNKVTYKWDNASWTFTPDNTADSTCKLYFVTTTNEIAVKATNGKVEELVNNKIKRGTDAVIKITPDEGYSYEKTTCTNNEVVEWNQDKTELTVKSVNAETTCNVSFIITKFNVEVKVNNGSGATKVEYEYGKKIEIAIAAATGHGTPSITCTNNQIASWNNGILTIDKLTKETVCTVDFKLLQTTSSYTVSLDVGSKGALASGTDTVTVLSGKSASWTVTVTDTNYVIDDVTCTAGTVNRQGNIITVKNITKNTECTVSYKENAGA